MGVIANSPDLDADDYIELHEGRRHGLSSTRGDSNLRLRCVSHLCCDPYPARARLPPSRSCSRSPRQEGVGEGVAIAAAADDDDDQTTG